jgi:succinoglycan biosynthesis transport protein ExoP
MVDQRQWRDGEDTDGSSGAGFQGQFESLDIREWLRTIRRRKSLIVSIVLIGLVLTFLVLNDLTPRYTAEAKVMIRSQDSKIVDFESVMAGIGSDAGAVAGEIEILTSQSLLKRLVEELDLVADPEFNPYLERKNPSWVKDLIADGKTAVTDLLDAIGLSGRKDNVTLTPEEQEELEQTATVNAVRGSLSIASVRLTSVIRISATSVNARKATTISNTLANLYIVDQLEAKFEATSQANDWLSERLEELRTQVVEAESLVAAYRVENSLGDLGDRSLIEQQLNDANAQLTFARSELAAAQASYNQVQNLLSTQGIESAAQVLANPLIQQLRQAEAEATRRLAELSTRYGELHPDIINANAEIQDLQSTIEGEVSKIVQNLSNEVAVARARSASIEQTVAGLNTSFDTERGAEVRLRELEREADATRQLYDTMLSRYKEVSEQENIQEPDARLISEAAVPMQPSWPKKTPAFAIAGFLLLILGIGLAFLLEKLRAGFRNLQDIEQATGIAGLLEVPLLRRGEKLPADQLMNDRTGPYAEAVRSLNTALALTNVDNPPKVISFVSSVPEEGKSSLVASLGRSASLGGRKVVIIDCDFRRPQHHKLAGVRRDVGLSDVLAGSASLEEVMVLDQQTNVMIVPSGKDVPNPANLLQSQKMRDVLTGLKEQFDFVFIDTPAIMALSDGLVATTISDGTIMLVRWEKTPREVVVATVQKLRHAGANLIGTVLSQVDQKKQSGYGYSAYGYYYGRYKSYYSK